MKPMFLWEVLSLLNGDSVPQSFLTLPPVRMKHRLKLDTRVRKGYDFYRFYCRCCPKFIWLSVDTVQHLTLARCQGNPRIRLDLDLGECTGLSIRERELRMKGYVIGD